jgi:hypothetical protein
MQPAQNLAPSPHQNPSQISVPCLVGFSLPSNLQIFRVCCVADLSMLLSFNIPISSTFEQFASCQGIHIPTPISQGSVCPALHLCIRSFLASARQIQSPATVKACHCFMLNTEGLPPVELVAILPPLPVVSAQLGSSVT